jgi:hypothetical protein
MGNTRKSKAAKKRTSSQTSPELTNSAPGKRLQIMTDQISSIENNCPSNNTYINSPAYEMQNIQGAQNIQQLGMQTSGSFIELIPPFNRSTAGHYQSPPPQVYATPTQPRIHNVHSFSDTSFQNTVLNKLEMMDKRLQKLDNIELQVSSMAQKMNSMDTRITFLESKLTDYNSKVVDIEISRAHDSQTCDELISKQNSIDKLLHDEKIKSEKISSDLTRLQLENNRLSEEIVDLQMRSMRDNLLFFNFPEEATTESRKSENCNSKIMNFCSDDLDIDNVKIDRSHRIGKFQHGKVRPIVAKFHDPPVKETVKRVAYERKDSISKGVNDQYPKIIQERRKQLIPWMLKARYIHKQAVLDRDRLFIDNKMYTVNSLPIKELEKVVVPDSPRRPNARLAQPPVNAQGSDAPAQDITSAEMS